MKNWKFFKITILITVLFHLSSCQANAYGWFEKQPPKTPLYIPFDVTKAGNKLETEFTADETHHYVFLFRFYPNPEGRKIAETYQWGWTRAIFYILTHGRDSYKLSPEQIVEYKRIAKLVGDIPDYAQTEDRKKIEIKGELEPVFHNNLNQINGKITFGYNEHSIKYKYNNPGIPMPVKFKIFAKEKSGYKLIFEIERDTYPDNHDTKIITGMMLNPGVYKVIVETIKDSPEFIGTDVDLEIYKQFYGK